MSLTIEERLTSKKVAFLSYGFRPFFLASALWAFIALALWMVVLKTGTALPSRFDPLAWHIHEMFFGFVMAAIAGFLLTAIPNWTGRQPVSGALLGLLAFVWLWGRVVCLISVWLPPWLSITTDLAFPILLASVVAHEIIAANSRRNMMMIVPVAVLGVANLLMHLEAIGIDISEGLGWRLALSAILVLVSVVGGRIIPNFTRNWLSARQVERLQTVHGPVDRVALGVLHAGLFGWAFLPTIWPVGIILVLGSMLNLWRLLRWHGVQTTAEPLLTILHIGYGWLCLGAGFLGVSVLSPAVPLSAGIHTLTVGAIGTMILAVMTRVTRGHTGGVLSADCVTVALYLCVFSATILRVTAAFFTEFLMTFLVTAAALWIAAFLLFIVRYGAMLCLSNKHMRD